jgi:very-short-patch-repair endonuclease
MRFWNNGVNKNMNGVLQEIVSVLGSPSTLAKGEVPKAEGVFLC